MHACNEDKHATKETLVLTTLVNFLDTKDMAVDMWSIRKISYR